MSVLLVLLSAVVIAGGFIVLHFALTHRTRELKAAGWTLVIGGVIAIVLSCMSYGSRPHKFAYKHFPPAVKNIAQDDCEGEPRAPEGKKMTIEAPPPPRDKGI